MSGPFDSLLELTEKKNPHVATVKLIEISGRYRFGPPVRPAIQHDNGHLDTNGQLDTSKMREPTNADYVKLGAWKAALRGMETFRKDLCDATAAYRHFLFGNGADRSIDYERYLKGDLAGVELLHAVINDFRVHAEIIGKDRTLFSVTGEPYVVGRGCFVRGPETENWQKTVGEHYLWVHANVLVSADARGKIWYNADITLHMEDRYNFNPGQNDVATGIADAENGRFELTGLAKQYTNFGTVVRNTKWADGERE